MARVASHDERPQRVGPVRQGIQPHELPLRDTLHLVQELAQDRIPAVEPALHLLEVAGRLRHAVGQVVGAEQHDVIHCAGAHRVRNDVSEWARPEIHRRGVDEVFQDGRVRAVQVGGVDDDAVG